MNILHIDMGREMRGGQHQVMLLLRGLSEAGHTCELLARPGTPLAAAAAKAGIAVHPATMPVLWNRSKAIDIVHAHDARGHSLAALASRQSFVVSRRVAFPVRRTLLSRWKYSKPVRYMAVSEFVASRLVAAGVRRECIDVVADAVEEAPFCGWSADSPVVAPAFRNDRNKLSNLTEEACKQANAPLLFSSDLSRDLRHASVFLYLTQSEGFGSAALLAMAMGVPVVASRVEGLAEVLEDGRSGLYVDNAPGPAAQAIRRILQEPALAEQLRRAGRSRVCEQFSLAKLVTRTVESYRRSVAR